MAIESDAVPPAGAGDERVALAWSPVDCAAEGDSDWVDMSMSAHGIELEEAAPALRLVAPCSNIPGAVVRPANGGPTCPGFRVSGVLGPH